MRNGFLTRAHSARATPAMNDTTVLPFSFPSVGRKKVTADFDGGRLTSDGGVMLLSMAERRLGVAETASRVRLAFAAGYPEAGLAQVLLYRTQNTYDQHLDEITRDDAERTFLLLVGKKRE